MQRRKSSHKGSASSRWSFLFGQSATAPEVPTIRHLNERPVSMTDATVVNGDFVGGNSLRIQDIQVI